MERYWELYLDKLDKKNLDEMLNMLEGRQSVYIGLAVSYLPTNHVTRILDKG